MRAQSLIDQAARQGVQLVVLPELFNTGYAYTPQNYQLAEPLEGTTASWMKDTARRQNVHLAGSFLLHAEDGIYNTMVLVAPDGNLWRYDKSYPWAWERAYFRPRRNPIRAADTELGKIGMLICWDVSHPALWRQYAGRIDLFISSSCPPLIHELDIHLPDGKIVRSGELGKILQLAYRGADRTFGEFYLNQARWLGVPSVNTTGAGRFESQLPLPRLSAASFFALRPDLWKYIPGAGQIEISAGYFADTFIADAGGNPLAATKGEGDGLVAATVELAENTPQPNSPQPAYGLNVLAYLVDFYVNATLKHYYHRHWHRLARGADH